jgi:uncharacterized sulfatase
VRSPLIVWGPGWIAKEAVGTVNSQSILCALDLNRSIYSITGASLPDPSVLDGEDLASTLLGKQRGRRKVPIFWRRPPDRPGTKERDNPDLAVRDGKWKYLVNYDGSDPQLYDLDADVAESRNLADEKKEVVARLHAALMTWNASMPKDAGDPTFE